MGIRKRMALLLHLFILWSANGVTKGLETEQMSQSNLDSDDGVIHSHVKLHTCCGINLDLPETSCGSENSKDRSQPSLSWTFPRNMMAENVSTNFQLQTRKIQCQAGVSNKVYVSAYSSRPDASNKLLRNGYLKVGIEYFPRDEYCINSKNDTDLEFHVCPQNCTGSRPCIKKCCSLDKVYSLGANEKMVKKGCQALPQGEYFRPVFYDDYATKSSHHIPEPHYIEHYPSNFKYNCPRNRTTFFLFPAAAHNYTEFRKYTFNGIVYRIREDGKILYKHAKDGKCGFLDAGTDDFCVDGVINYHSGYNNLTYKNHETEIVMFLCPQAAPENTETKKIVGMLYGVVMLVSSIFLLVTIATYLALWERQSVHGWTIVSHTLSLFFMYIFLGIAHIIGVNSGHDYLNTHSCIGIGIVTHFFFLSTFCWLFLISVDLWLTFRAFTPRSGKRSKGLGRYIKYSIVGWGIPLIIVMVGIILDKKYPEEHCHTLITPAYGKTSCFVQGKAMGVYLYYPIAVMIILNLVFFAITTYKLYLYRLSTKMATKDDKQQQFYRLFFKLFFIMGVLWVFEVISWAASGTGYQWYWIVFDMLNVLRALAVFIIFVCKRDIIFALEENYPCLKPILLPFAWLFKRRHSTHGDNSSMTRTSTLRQTISSDGKPESIGLMVNSHKLND